MVSGNWRFQTYLITLPSSGLSSARLDEAEVPACAPAVVKPAAPAHVAAVCCGYGPAQVVGVLLVAAERVSADWAALEHGAPERSEGHNDGLLAALGAAAPEAVL